MKSFKLLLIACVLQFSFESFAQTNHVLIFTTANQEYIINVMENDTIVVINEYQVGDFHYGYPGVTQNIFNVQIEDTICKFPVTFVDTVDAFYLFYGAMPGIPMTVYLNKQYLNVDDLQSNLGFEIAANPSSDYLKIKTETMEPVYLYSLTGQLVLSAESANEKIAISHLKAGTYLVQIGLHSKRLVIE